MLNIIATMNTETALLRVLLRMSRMAAPATLSDLVADVREDSDQVTQALRTLARAELVQRTEATVRLSFSGLAVAVSLAAKARALATATHEKPEVLHASAPAPRVVKHGSVIAWPTPKRRRTSAAAA